MLLGLSAAKIVHCLDGVQLEQCAAGKCGGWDNVVVGIWFCWNCEVTVMECYWDCAVQECCATGILF